MFPPKTSSPRNGQKLQKLHREKNMVDGSSIEVVSERRPRVPIWNPSLELDGALLPLDSSIRDFQKGKAGYVANALEQPLLFP